MNLKRMFVAGAAVFLTWCSTSQAATVYVSESAADVTYAQLGAGYNGQTGLTPGTAFGSIQAAYHYLWTQTGTHTINLISDGDGIWSQSEIGVNEFNNGTGYLRFVSGASHTGAFTSADPLWTSVTLDGNYSGTASLRLSDAGDGVDAWDIAEYKIARAPAAYEKETVTPTGNATNNRGDATRGLFNPGFTHALTGMFIEDLDIILGGGHILIGAGGASVAGLVQDFTFTNVNLTLQNDDFDNDTNTLDGDPWGQSVLWQHHMTQADLNASQVNFVNSNIYLKKDSGAAWGGNGDTLYVGSTFGAMQFPANLFDGGNSSRLWYWDGAQYTLRTNFTDIWEGHRNSNTLLYRENIDSGTQFLNYFLTTLPAVSEIVVSGNTVTIVDGDATPDLADWTDFGSTTVGTAIQRIFQIDNTGTGTLTLSGLSLPIGFSLIGVFPTSIAASSFATFTVQLDAASTGFYAGFLSFTNNDGDENPFNFAIQGEVQDAPPAGVPEPTTIALLALGAGLVVARRRMKS